MMESLGKGLNDSTAKFQTKAQEEDAIRRSINQFKSRTSASLSALNQSSLRSRPPLSKPRQDSRDSAEISDEDDKAVKVP